jgi:hypothetical protein
MNPLCIDCDQELVQADDGVSWEHAPDTDPCHTLVPIPQEA